MRRFAFAVIATTVLGLDGDDRDALFTTSRLDESAVLGSFGNPQ